mmetsp:Transcript_13756/g.18825  ORF Transcript_13756/g.18825 Transcript_13756/m.18825 type:complete len:80 (-) Transcript_13756:1015-1254(-)
MLNKIKQTQLLRIFDYFSSRIDDSISLFIAVVEVEQASEAGSAMGAAGGSSAGCTWQPSSSSAACCSCSWQQPLQQTYP